MEKNDDFVKDKKIKMGGRIFVLPSQLLPLFFFLLFGFG